jgi:hypothetical protein
LAVSLIGRCCSSRLRVAFCIIGLSGFIELL